MHTSKEIYRYVVHCLPAADLQFRAFVAEFEVYSKAESLESLTQLHSDIRSKLPSELRDMIYSYLDIQGTAYGDDPIKHFPISVDRGGFDPNFHDNEDLFLYEKTQEARRVFESGTFDSLKPGGWLLNPEYVGHGMARDIAEIFYSVNDFSIHINELREFLISDPTRTGLKPYEYIRHKVTIYVPTTLCNGSSERAWQTTENEIEFLNGLYAQLNSLVLITQQSHISVELWLVTSAQRRLNPEVGERRFYNIMESVRAPIYNLIHAGVNILVIHRYKRNSCTRTISEDPLNYFFMSKEEWETEKRGHGSTWMPSMNFITQEEFDDGKKEQGSMKRQLKKLMKQRWGHEDYEILEDWSLPIVQGSKTRLLNF